MNEATGSPVPLQGLAAMLDQASRAQRAQSADAMGERFQDTMDAIVSAYARAKIQRMEILNHNGSMLGHVSKMAMANAMGLDERQRLGVTPFPCPTNINISGGDQQLQRQLGSLCEQLAGRPQAAPSVAENDAPVRPTVQAGETNSPKSLWSKVWPLIAAAGLGIGGTAATMYATRPAPTGQGSVDLEIEGWQATGTPASTD